MPLDDEAREARPPRAAAAPGRLARAFTGSAVIARRALALALILLAGGAAGWVAARLSIPLPWMVGPLLLTAAIAIARGAPYAPIHLRWAGQMGVASAVATNMTPDTLAVVGAQVGLMLISAVFVIVLSGLLAAFTMRTSGVDRATALFASLPGGPMELAAVAQQYGGAGALVAFSQTLRIAAIVTLIPPLLILFGAEFHDITVRPIPIDPAGLSLVIGIALLAALALKRLNIGNAFFLGPLFGIGAATLLGAPVAPVPGEGIALAQIALGITLGKMFDRQLLIQSRAFLLQAAFISALLIIFTTSLAAAFTLIGPESFYLYVLGNAPGSITEMAVAAKGFDLDVSLVSGFHMVRIIIVLPMAAPIYRAFVRLTDWVESRRAT